MDDKNDSFKLFKNVFTNIIQEYFHGQYFNTTNRFNTSCTKETQCDSTAMFCNLTTLLCQCAEFHLWNDTIEICEFKQEHLTKWIEKNKTNDIIYITEIVPAKSMSKYAIPWPIMTVMIIGALCFLLCIGYVCYGEDKVDEDKTVSAALFKQHEQTRRIQTTIMENF
ncbi:uncharacterized protein LOC114119861 [Aphis gossypii]|uniref:uncharacterized protein LOC114119861 n=1 Tax=Aphis gossypii TaxID=80765 RepID=UPI002158D36F|nr:uncharacterized protein LOC114119861 [Aphis gossypii]